MSAHRIHPVDLMSQKTPATCIIDVRTAAEVKAAGLPDSINIPLHELTPERLQAEIVKHSKSGACVYLLCQAGRRAEMAAEQLAGKVGGQLYVVEGGMDAVKQSNITLNGAGPKVIPLERQVRIAAGLLVLIGAILGTWFNPVFYGLSAFVGAGLIFAGVSDICPMGMAIAKMPWNR